MAEKSPVRWQTAVFSRKVTEIMRDAPLTVPPGTPCGEVVQRLRTTGATGATGATVVDGDGRPIGIVTERDVARRIAFEIDPATAVEQVMTAPLRTIPHDEYLFHAIERMRRHDLRHMPAVDHDGRLVGMVNLIDALVLAAGRLMSRIQLLTDEGTVDSLRKIKKAQARLAEELLEDNLPAPEVLAFLTRVNNDIYRRIVNMAIRDMEAGGWGRPPVRFAVIVMGSGGRGENYLFPDQDNGFILEDYPDAEHNRIDKYFIELAERMTRDLDAVGIPFCNGYCMAVNPLWRKTLSQWIEQVELWGRKRNFVAIRLSDIFFDFQPVWGDVELAGTLRREVTRIIGANHFFLQQMYAKEKDHNVALSFFGNIITEKDNKEHKGKVNLKHTGTLPLVEAIRLLSLRAGITETSTLGRIAALHRAGAMEDGEHDNLSGAFHLLTDILIRRQISDFLDGKKVGYHLNPDKLKKRRRKRLVEALKDIDDLRDRVKAEFTGDVF